MLALTPLTHHLLIGRVHGCCFCFKSVCKSFTSTLPPLLYLFSSPVFVAKSPKAAFSTQLQKNVILKLPKTAFHETCSHQSITISNALKCIFSLISYGNESFPPTPAFSHFVSPSNTHGQGQQEGIFTDKYEKGIWHF